MKWLITRIIEGKNLKKPPHKEVATAGMSYFLLLCGFGADQVVKRAQGRFCTFASRDDDLLVRHGGAVARGKHALHAGLTLRINDDFAHAVALNRAFQPVVFGSRPICTKIPESCTL